MAATSQAQAEATKAAQRAGIVIGHAMSMVSRQVEQEPSLLCIVSSV